MSYFIYLVETQFNEVTSQKNLFSSDEHWPINYQEYPAKCYVVITLGTFLFFSNIGSFI